MDTLTWVLTGFLALGFLAGVHFMWTYTRRWAWWKDEHGAHLGMFTLSLTLIMGLYLIRPFVDAQVFGYVRAPFFVLVVACMVWRDVLLLKADRERPRGVH
jgi:hypothetical protein